jgi:hypothetical protein
LYRRINMKRITLIIVLALMVISGTLLPGCIRVDIADEVGPAVTRVYDITGFTGIEAGYAFKVDISRSDNYSISITISEKFADRLRVTKIGDTLLIGLKEPAWNVHSRPEVTITLPDLRSLELSGAAEGKVRGFKSSNDFDLEVSGASYLDIDMEAVDLKASVSGASGVNGFLKALSSDIEASGASRITLTGSGGDIRLDVSGASQANLENYAVGNADVELSGAGQAKMEISGKLNADLSGASHLEYGGKPTLGRIETSGGSSLKPR